MENWTPAFGYEGIYEVSDLGNCRRNGPGGKKRGQNLIGGDRRGYRSWSLCVNSNTHYESSHRLVWQSFNRPLTEGEQINHVNGVKDDNRLINLEACTGSENQLHSIYILGNRGPNPPPAPGTKNNKAKLSEADIPAIFERLKAETQTAIARDYGVSQTTISRIALGKGWKHVT